MSHRVLLAEDNEINQRLVVQMLKALGCLVDVVENGREAVDAIEQDRYDLVLMDWRMPEMDGLQAARIIRDREQSEGRARVPMVALTANALPDDRETCLAAGMDGFLSKPLMLDDLRGVVDGLAGSTPSPEPASPRDTKEPAAGPAPTDGPLNPRALDGIRELQLPGRPSLVKQVIEIYLESTPLLLAALREAVDAGDLAAVTMAAHKMKSSNAELGATDLAGLAGEMENQSRAGSLIDPHEVLGRIEAGLVTVQAALGRILETEK